MTVEYQCCFCEQGVERADQDAVRITFRNMWEGEQSQELYAHLSCAEERLQQVLAPSVPLYLSELKD